MPDNRRTLIFFHDSALTKNNLSYASLPVIGRCFVNYSLRCNNSVEISFLESKENTNHFLKPLEFPCQILLFIYFLLLLLLYSYVSGQCNIYQECRLVVLYDKETVIMAPYGIGQTIIFSSCRLFYLSSSSFFPRLISAVADWMSTILPNMVRP